jgi:hypothetical protein
VPANNSATGLFQILNDNKGIGLIFETEGDTLAQTFGATFRSNTTSAEFNTRCRKGQASFILSIYSMFSRWTIMT